MRRQNKKHRTIRKHKSGPNFTGQHLLHNPRTIKELIETARIEPADTVLEIGAGKGVLTLPIADKASRVIAVEIDTGYVEALRDKTKDHPHVKMIQGDIKSFRLPTQPFCVVANIPFAITTIILEKLLGPEGKAFQRGVLLVEEGAARGFTQKVTMDARLLRWRMALKNAGVHREQAVASLALEQWAALFLTMMQHVAPYRWPKG